MSQPTLIVIQGGSATGKTTIARKLSKDLGVHLFTKDDFKELLYDKLGKPKDREESRLYGKAATYALYAATEAFLNDGVSVIIESAFHKQYATEDIGKIIHKFEVDAIQVFCAASPETRTNRYNTRIANGERHEGHPDPIGSVTIDSFRNEGETYGALDIRKTFRVDTDAFGDSEYQDLLNSVKMEIAQL